MKIIKLTAENVKRLRAVQIEPNGNVVILAGRNGQGKTSVLDSIWFALGGGAATKETTKPIRDGEEQASVELDLGDFVVRRTWSGEKTTLTVTAKDGARYPSPQTFLDEKLGALSFDPLAFAQQEPKAQVATLLSLVDLPFDPDDLAVRRRKFYDERTEIGRALRSAEARVAAFPKFRDDLPDEPVSASVILEEREAHRLEVQRYDEAENELDALADKISAETENAAEYENQARLAKARLATAVAEREAKAAAFALIDSPPAVDFNARLADVEATNEQVRARQQRDQAVTAAAEYKAQHDGMSAAIIELDNLKTQALAAAKMPVDGLGFDEDGVTYNGVPFIQCSSAEQLRVSLAMAMALNPTIRVIRVSDGSLLDSENMRVIADMADQHDFQCWIERVDESGEIGFVIEDGTVVAVPQRGPHE